MLVRDSNAPQKPASPAPRLERGRWPLGWLQTNSDTQARNFRNIALDGIALGYTNAAAPFLPVLLARLGALDFAVGLLTALPALGGLVFALPAGRLLSRQRKVVPWFATARLIAASAYALTGLVVFVLTDHRVEAILLIWALVTLPQTILDVGFPIVMASATGVERRLDVVSLRWSILGVTTALMIAVVGYVLDRLPFPVNFQIAFLAISFGGLASYYLSRRIVLPSQETSSAHPLLPLSRRVKEWLQLGRGRSKFARFTVSQFVYRFGLAFALPLFPLYYVHILHASNLAIGIINTVQSAVLIVAYFIWVRVSRRVGMRSALLVATGAICLDPILLSFTTQVEIAILLAGLAGIFAAGIDLLFFDALVSSFPPESSAMFVGLYQITVYVASFVAPLVGTLLSGAIGLSGALLAAGTVDVIGFGLFASLMKE